MEPDADLKSYLRGISERPLVGLTVGQLLEQSATDHPENDALIVPYQNLR